MFRLEGEGWPFSLWLETSPLGIKRLWFDPLDASPIEYPREGWESPREGLVRALTDVLEAYFQGEKVEFRGFPLDYTGLHPTRVAVYEWVRGIPYGRVRSYKEVGQALGLSARAVGMALRSVPLFLLVPAHRVVHADGRIGGFAGWEGIKAWLLQLEGLDLSPNGHLKGRKRRAV